MGCGVSLGAIVDATQRVAGQAQAVMADRVERIRGSPVVHVDETGWRENGYNGYVWTFSTPTQRYYPCPSQGQALRRDIHDLRALYPDDAPLCQWADAVHQLYRQAAVLTHPSERQRPKRQRRIAQLALEKRLLALCRPYLDDRPALRPGYADASSATARACPALDTGNSSSSSVNPRCLRTTTPPGAGCARRWSAGRSVVARAQTRALTPK